LPLDKQKGVLRKQGAGGRHQIGTVAGFRLEQGAGFVLECMADIVGTRTDGTETTALIIYEVSEHALLNNVASSAEFEKFSKEANAWVPADPALEQVRCLQGQKYQLRLPPLAGKRRRTVHVSCGIFLRFRVRSL